MTSVKLQIKTFLENKILPVRAIYISSYIPRRCGIATFTKDLTTAINNQNPFALSEIIAINDNGNNYDYPWEVKFRIHPTNPQDYMDSANYINQSSADVVCLQHEFGLFGGVNGDYILPMIDLIEKPLVVNFHSVLPSPDEHKKYIVKRIIEKASVVVAMTEKSRELLHEVYGADLENIIVVYHGVPDITFEDTAKYKKELKIKADHVVFLSGLISRGKGFEYVIEALPEIIQKFPSTQVIIHGATHPSILQQEGEAYRESLIKKARKLKVGKNVKFINRYISLEELVSYYKAADICITPHLDEQQPTSGTLAYALGTGKVCISTPFFYAKELLANGVGIIVPFRDSKAISGSIIDVLSNPDKMMNYRKTAYKIGRTMTWSTVASKYLAIFRSIIKAHNGHQE